MNSLLNHIPNRISSKSSIVILFTTLLTVFGAKGQQFIDLSEQWGVTATPDTHDFGSGISTYDFDNDGWDDISLCNDFGELFIYKNMGLSGFELVDMDLLAPGESKMLLWVDYDNDGLLDLFLTTQGGQNVLYKNLGDFEFEDYTEAAGLPITDDLDDGASFGDYDRDGYLDLYICKYANYIGAPVNSVRYNRLYHNNGDGTFTDVTVSAGVERIPHMSLQSVFADVNNDNWPDIHVINDRLPGNFLFLNNQDGTFTEVTYSYNVSYPNNCVMSNSIGDFDHDGDLDIFMTNNGGPGHPSLLAQNQFGLFFDERAEFYNVDLYEFAWGATWIDANNDTWDDLVIALPYAEPNRYLESNSGTIFTEIDGAISATSEYMSYNPSKGDFNNDGYMDVAIQATSPYHPYVLRNVGGENYYVKITLEGTLSNKGGIGSWIKLYANGTEQVKYTLCGENYHGQNSQHKHFGLGNVGLIDSISVLYPSGHTDVYYDLIANGSYYFTEGETFVVNIETDGQPEFCPGDSVLLDAGVYDNYLWSSGETTQTVWAADSGDYFVQVENEFGIIAIDTISVEENPNPVLSNTITMPLCYSDSSGAIEVINLLSISPDSVVWGNGANGLILDSLPAGEYSYTYYDRNGCQASSSAVILEPSAMVFFASSTPEIGESENGTISITIFGGTSPYEIYHEDELVSDFLTGLSASDYTFEIIDNNGCQSSITITVETTLSIVSTEENTIEIFPNPFTNSFQINSETDVESVVLTDIEGKIVLNSYAANSRIYDVQHLPKGAYIVTVTFRDKSNAVQRLIKQ